MQVSKWGNSLGVRLPVELVRALGLKAGSVCEVVAVGPCGFTVRVEPSPEEDRQFHLQALRSFRGHMPKGFRFSREQAHER